MICVTKDVLRKQFGVSNADINKLWMMFPSTGLLPCDWHKFNDMQEGRPHGKRPFEWLDKEPKRKGLLLIGMSDPSSSGMHASGCIVCVAYTNGDDPLRMRPLFDHERAEVPVLLRAYGWSDIEAAIAIVMGEPSQDQTAVVILDRQSDTYEIPSCVTCGKRGHTADDHKR